MSQRRTLQDITEKLINSFPNKYGTIYVFCKTYETGSIKTSKRQPRESRECCKLTTPDMKLPYDVNKYLSMGEDKMDLTSLSKQYREINTRQCRVYFCLCDCFEIEQNDEHRRLDLFSNHGEVDTKEISYTKQVEKENHIMVRTPSGDIDIIELFVYLFMALI